MTVFPTMGAAHFFLVWNYSESYESALSTYYGWEEAPALLFEHKDLHHSQNQIYREVKDSLNSGFMEIKC